MKTLIFSDLHLHNWKYGARTLENGYNSRLWDQKLALDRIVEVVDTEDISQVVFCGDFFHTPGHVPTECLNVAADFIDKINCQITMLVGNHDMSSKNGFIHSLSPWSNKVNIVPPRCSDKWQMGWTSFYALGYTDDPEVISNFLENIPPTDVGRHVVFMHQGVAGIPMGSGYVINEHLNVDMVPPNVQVFTGHYHTPRKVNDSLTIIGSLTAQNWNDIDQDKMFIIYDQYTHTWEWRASRAPKFVSMSSGQDYNGNFLRVDYPIKADEVDNTRDRLLCKGALTVEFPNIIRDEVEKEVVTNEVFDIDKYFEELHADMDERRIEVGRELRAGTYEITQR